MQRKSPKANKQQLIHEIMKTPSKVFNVSIVAHVDHGKTSLTDCLLASNAIISKRMAGKLKYLDFREDEQEKEITMKSSAVSLLFKDPKSSNYFLF